MKTLRVRIAFFLLGYIFLCVSNSWHWDISGAFAGTLSESPSRVGNGDDGADLEKLSKIESGPIVDAQKRALELVRKLNSAGVSGLGALEPEIERSPLFMASEDVPANLDEDQGVFHSSMQGKVFARTLPEPYAATRFFPAAHALQEEQLMALHIHEALHRALPESVRTSESVVSALTLAITSSGTTHDTLVASSQRWIPQASEGMQERGSGSARSLTDGRSSVGVASDARVRQPSLFSYEFRKYQQSDSPGISSMRPSGAHVIRSDLYPFGDESSTLGVGIEGSVIHSPERSGMGPLGISGKMRLWSGRGFDVGAWGMASLNVLSTQELKNSALGRDVASLGLSMRKDLRWLTVENRIGYTFDGTAEQTIGALTYRYEFGPIVLASVSAALRIAQFRLGGFADLHLADSYRVSGGAFQFDSGRYRLLSGGPRFSYETLDFVASLSGQFVLDSTQDANLDYLGNLLGQGAGQGAWIVSLGVFF
jgi:hypothetical protein